MSVLVSRQREWLVCRKVFLTPRVGNSPLLPSGTVKTASAGGGRVMIRDPLQCRRLSDFTPDFRVATLTGHTVIAAAGALG